jgi:sensor domain CHASE-containing protein
LTALLFSSLIEPRFIEIESKQMDQTLERFGSAFAAEAAELATRAKDWGYWDDAVNFIEGRHSSFPDNFPESAVDVVKLDSDYFEQA